MDAPPPPSWWLPAGHSSLQLFGAVRLAKVSAPSTPHGCRMTRSRLQLAPVGDVVDGAWDAFECCALPSTRFVMKPQQWIFPTFGWGRGSVRPARYRPSPVFCFCDLRDTNQLVVFDSRMPRPVSCELPAMATWTRSWIISKTTRTSTLAMR